MRNFNKIKGIIYAFISSGSFGLIPLFSLPLIKENKMDISSVLFYRYLFSSIILFILCLLKGNRLVFPFKTFIKIIGLAIFSIYTASALIYSYSYIPSGTATTIHFLYPVFVSLFMIFFYKERVSRNLIISAIISLIGVACLSWNGNKLLNIKGLLIAFSTAITYAIYIVGLNQKKIKIINSKVITFYVMAIGTLVLGSYTFFHHRIEPITSSFNWFNLIMLALVPTVISNITLVQAVKFTGSTTTSILGSSEPLVAVIIGVLFFSENFTLYSLLGLILIIISVSYVVFFNARKNNR